MTDRQIDPDESTDPNASTDPAPTTPLEIPEASPAMPVPPPPPVTPQPPPPPVTPQPPPPPQPASGQPWPPPSWGRRSNDPGRLGTIILGLVLLVIGLWFFADQTLGLDMPSLRWSQLWPLFIIGLGAWIAIGSMRRS